MRPEMLEKVCRWEIKEAEMMGKKENFGVGWFCFLPDQPCDQDNLFQLSKTPFSYLYCRDKIMGLNDTMNIKALSMTPSS